MFSLGSPGSAVPSPPSSLTKSWHQPKSGQAPPLLETCDTPSQAGWSPSFSPPDTTLPRHPPSGHQRPFHLLMPPPGSSPQVSTWLPRPQGTPAPCLPSPTAEGPVGCAAPTRAGVLLLRRGDETPHVGAAFQLPKCTFQPPSLTPSPFPGRPSSS